ncbi:MAG: vitamin K epoxide reductase family protein [Thermoplasmata archaeon]
MRTSTARNIVYLAAGIGLIVALFATAEFLDPGLSAVCSITSYYSCGKVAASGLTTTLGIPDWVWGVAGFVLILVVAALAEQRPDDRRRAYSLLGVTSVGVALALYLLYVELHLIHALCPVCASAYVLGGIAWLGSIELARRPPDDGGDDDETDDPPDEDA